MKAATGFVAACLVTVFALPVENNAFAGFIEASANSQVIEAGVVDSCTAPNTLTGHAACSSGPATISFGTSTLQYAVSSEGIASFGSLRTFVSALVTAHVGNIGLSNNQVIARATVQFEDVLTLTHAPATGHVAFLIHSSGTEQTVVIGPNPVAAANSFAQTTLHSISEERPLFYPMATRILSLIIRLHPLWVWRRSLLAFSWTRPSDVSTSIKLLATA
ncbi:MAG: hypothetical protein ACXWCQ_30805 [Burkholderiales bacterium]